MKDRSKINLSAISLAAKVTEDDSGELVKLDRLNFAYPAKKQLRKRAKTCALAHDITLGKFLEDAVEVALQKFE